MGVYVSMYNFFGLILSSLLFFMLNLLASNPALAMPIPKIVRESKEATMMTKNRETYMNCFA